MNNNQYSPTHKLSDINGLNNLLSRNLKSVLFINIRSIRANFHYLTNLLESLNQCFSFIILNETWLGPGEETMFQIDGYTSFSLPRNRHGGGLIIFCQINLQAHVIETLSFITDSFEALFLDVKINTTQFTIGTVYRPPSLNVNSFITEFKDTILTKLHPGQVIICGDININVNDQLNRQVMNFTAEMANFGFENLITEFTRVTTHSRSIIDHIWTSYPNVDESFVLELAISDHYPIGCVINIPNNQDTKKVKFRKLYEENIPPLKREFLYLSGTIHFTEVNPTFSYVIKSLKNMITKFFPIRTQYKKNKVLKSPWIDKDLKSLISKKHRIYRQYILGLIPFSRYRFYRNLLDKTLKLAKKIYFRTNFRNINNNQRETWKVINKVTNPCRKTRKITVKIDNEIISDEYTISTKVNRFFRNEAPPSKFNQYQYSRYMENLIPFNQHTFHFTPFTPLDIESVLNRTKNNSLTADLPICILKTLKEPLCVLLSQLFNFAISESTFPDDLRTGSITPIPKKPNSKAIKDLRPITIQNPISKFFDKGLYDKITPFFEKYELISPFQFGFQRNKGIEQAAQNLMYNINKANNRNEFMVVIFIDLSRAFNSVNLDKLLGKLFRLGIRGNLLDFFESYLKNRSHTTRINEAESTPLTDECGIAQGTNLSPLLFNLFMNDVTQVINDCHIYLYADDIVIFKSSPDINELTDCIQTNLNKFSEWTDFNDLEINMSKTKRMNFSRKKMPDIPLYMKNTLIEATNEYKYLGLIIDSKLSFKQHVAHVKKKVDQANGKIFYLKRFLPIYILKKIYYSLIFPYLNQHILIWGGTSPTILTPLNTSVNKVIRNILPSDDRTIIKYKKLNVLTINQLYELRLGQFFFKSLKLGKQILLEDIFHDLNFTHNYNTRNLDNFRLPLTSTQVNRHFFINNGVRVWNVIPIDIKNSKSLYTFTNKFKEMCFLIE